MFPGGEAQRGRGERAVGELDASRSNKRIRGAATDAGAASGVPAADAIAQQRGEGITPAPVAPSPVPASAPAPTAPALPPASDPPAVQFGAFRTAPNLPAALSAPAAPPAAAAAAGAGGGLRSLKARARAQAAAAAAAQAASTSSPLPAAAATTAAAAQAASASSQLPAAAAATAAAAQAPSASPQLPAAPAATAAAAEAATAAPATAAVVAAGAGAAAKPNAAQVANVGQLSESYERGSSVAGPEGPEGRTEGGAAAAGDPIGEGGARAGGKPALRAAPSAADAVSQRAAAGGTSAAGDPIGEGGARAGGKPALRVARAGEGAADAASQRAAAGRTSAAGDPIGEGGARAGGKPALREARGGEGAADAASQRAAAGRTSAAGDPIGEGGARAGGKPARGAARGGECAAHAAHAGAAESSSRRVRVSIASQTDPLSREDQELLKRSTIAEILTARDGSEGGGAGLVVKRRHPDGSVGWAAMASRDVAKEDPLKLIAFYESRLSFKKSKTAASAPSAPPEPEPEPEPQAPGLEESDEMHKQAEEPPASASAPSAPPDPEPEPQGPAAGLEESDDMQAEEPPKQPSEPQAPSLGESDDMHTQAEEAQQDPKPPKQSRVVQIFTAQRGSSPEGGIDLVVSYEQPDGSVRRISMSSRDVAQEDPSYWPAEPHADASASPFAYPEGPCTQEDPLKVVAYYESRLHFRASTPKGTFDGAATDPELLKQSSLAEVLTARKGADGGVYLVVSRRHPDGSVARATMASRDVAEVRR
eukprot:tig00000057_g36.t1